MIKMFKKILPQGSVCLRDRKRTQITHTHTHITHHTSHESHTHYTHSVTLTHTSPVSVSNITSDGKDWIPREVARSARSRLPCISKGKEGHGMDLRYSLKALALVSWLTNKTSHDEDEEDSEDRDCCWS